MTLSINTLFFLGVSVFSLSWGLLSWRLQRYGYIFTNIISLIFSVWAIGDWANVSPENSQNLNLILVLSLEVFASYFLVRREQKMSLLPYYSVPLIQVSFLAIFLTYSEPKFHILFLIFSVIFDIILGAVEKRTKESIGKVTIMIVALLTIVLITRLDAGRLSIPLLVFIYWVSQKAFPFGLSSESTDIQNYSLTGRTALIIFALGDYAITTSPFLLFGIGTTIAIFSGLFFYLLEGDFKSWRLIKQTNEILLIITNIVAYRSFGKESLVLIILFNLYYFGPFLLNALSFQEKLKKGMMFGLFLFVNGLFLGGINTFINNLLSQSDFKVLVPNIFLLLSLFWSLNLIYFVRFGKLQEEDRKIEHFHPLFFASVIITSIIISF